jgi:hypothetical protein
MTAWSKNSKGSSYGTAFVTLLLSVVLVEGATLTGNFSSIPSGSVVDLTTVGMVDWVHWGLYSETSLNRKAGVVPQISDFTPLDASTGFVFIYQFADNANGYSWSDGTPTASVMDTTTGVWAYGTPLIGSGFQVSAPADTAIRTLKVYVGAFKARGHFEAYLTDGSAPPYSSTALSNIRNGPSGVYTLTYAAASPGQELILRWTLSIPNGLDANVTLQAAALTFSAANNPPLVTLTNPVNNAVFSAGGDILLGAAAGDLDGTVVTVEFFEGDNKLGEAAEAPYHFTWNNVPAGLHQIVAHATDDQGAISISSPVEVFVHGTGGTLAGSITLPVGLPAAVNLTSDGKRDWVHWGLAANASVNRKANVVPQIADFTKLGPNAVVRYDDNYTAFSWNDGIPAITAAGTTTGVFSYGLNEGFEITVPADLALRTLQVYAGLSAAQGNFQAWLSDFSAPAYTDTTLSSVGNAYAVYRIAYAAATAGQQLTVRYRSRNLFDPDFGNVTLQAATLVAEPAPATILNPAVTNGEFGLSLVTEAGRNYTVEFCEVLPSVQWQILTNLVGSGATAAVSDPETNHRQRFYRVSVQ